LEARLPNTLKAVREKIGRLKRYARITKVDEIARRYFILNAFDGAIASLGVIIGAYSSGVQDPKLIIGLGLSLSLSMGISGFSGAYIAEKAERARMLKEVEEALFTKIEGSILARASSFAVFWVALVDGASPAIATLIALTPFILVSLGLLAFTTAVAASVSLIIALLSALGAYMGRVSKENILMSSVRSALIGGITAVLCMMVGGVS